MQHNDDSRDVMPGRYRVDGEARGLAEGQR
jgi:hypothetical protein